MTQEEENLEAYVRISQYLANLSYEANPFEEVRHILKSELGPEYICFFTSQPKNKAMECHEGCWHEGYCPLPQVFQPESLEVLEDEFIDTVVIDSTPDEAEKHPLSVIFLPLPVKHHPPCVISIAYAGETSFDKGTLNIHLGIAGIVANALDRITDEKERIAAMSARQEVREELAVAEATLRTRGTFYASISHDIRSPIAAISSLSDLLLADNPRPEQEDLLKAIRSSTDTLLNLLSDVMDFSRMEAGKLSIRSVPFNPVAVSTEITHLLTEQAHQKSLDFECHTDDADPGPYLGDPLRIRQVLMNLLTNAIKFTSSGRVTLDLRTEPLSQTHDVLLFEVSDTGIGIPEEKLKDIFEAFQQADDQTAERYGGTGLGLTISKSLVERMGGMIDVSSNEKGSRFRVSIPLKRAPASD